LFLKWFIKQTVNNEDDEREMRDSCGSSGTVETLQLKSTNYFF